MLHVGCLRSCDDFASPTGRGIQLTALLSQQIDKIWRADKGRQQPAGIWNGNSTIRPHQSANTSSNPPTSAEITMCGIVRRKPIIRAICGAIKPTKLNGPMVIVAVAVRQAANSTAQFASASAPSPRLVRYHLPAVKWSASGGTAGNRQQNHHHNSGTPDLRIGRVVGRTGNPVRTCAIRGSPLACNIIKSMVNAVLNAIPASNMRCGKIHRVRRRS